jgi:L-ascorbate metabolism protein UlaG (beta-lactamase superfamily)
MLWPALLVEALAVADGSGLARAMFARDRTDSLLYRNPPRNAITFWGHACVYIDVDGLGIVTDPVFGARYSPFHARVIPAPPRSAYERTSLILISHAHQDHLQPKTLARFPRTAVILCPRPSARYIPPGGPQVHVMRPGDGYPFPGGSVTAVIALHPGGRSSLKARADGRALGYVIRTPRGTIYYSGDTEYFPGIEDVGTRYRPDVAILNATRHLPTPDVLHAILSLGVSRSILIHWGAYDGPAGRAARRRHEKLLALLGPAAVPLAVGESATLDGRVPAGPTPAP